MAKEICISSTPHETRLAILEDEQLAEIYYERENEYTLAGSIYNGRVTRVLPGMQSAFVDLGLERDAFLYVTDFLELEDQEESDELEKAAASGGNQLPREIRHTNGPGSEAAAKIEPRPESRPDERQGRGEPGRSGPGRGEQARGDQERPRREGSRDAGRERRSTVEAGTETPLAELAPSEPKNVMGHADEAEGEAAESGDQGAKRWRGRRRRRGGRGGPGHVADPVETESSAEVFVEPVTEMEVAPEIQASGSQEVQSAGFAHRMARGERAERSERGERAPVPFVLPGESLSKYGGEAAADKPSAPSAAPVRPASSFKPATLVEAPLQWDGSGLLPGESLSRHRSRNAGPETGMNGEPQGVFSDAGEAEMVEETAEYAPQSSHGVYEAKQSHAGDLITEELVEEEEPVEQLPGASAEPGTTQPAGSVDAETAAVKESDPFEADPFFTETVELAKS